MRKYITPYKLFSAIALSVILTACGGGGDSSSPKATLNGGLDCFATGATVANTTEGSGIALFFNSLMYPSNTNTGTPWTFLLPAALNLTGTPSYNYTTCTDKYATIVDTVVAQDRNKNGTYNDGSADSYAALRTAIATSTANFVGLDTFYYAADNLGLGNPTGLTASAFKNSLETTCNGTVTGVDLNATGVCPNGTFMNNVLWRTNGLFANNGSANFVGVQPSNSVGGNPGLTWTRGYLLNTYSSYGNTTPFYTAIFDAGSSGTRLSFYLVTPSTVGGKATISSEFNKKYKDSGINDFMSGKGTISTSALPGGQLPAGCNGTSNLGQDQVGPCVLQPLLDYLTTQLPTGVAPSSIKIELFATAGMRTEDIKNGGAFTTAQISNFYDNIMKPYVMTTTLSGGALYSNAGSFKTINGNSEEGVWSWINLNDVYYNTFATQGSCGNAPIGDFEVGGSSMQVAFPVANTSVASDANNIYQVNINGCPIKVYSKTFLGLGGDDARKFMRAYNY
jgi:hypothetical protein